VESEDAQVMLRLSGSSDKPVAFTLEQNFPNPFNPTTTFSYSIASSSVVSLKLYDLLGKEVATLVDEKKETGKYSVSWDAANFASGMYFYELKAGSFTDVKKMVLIK
jgi:hypothetical protein